MQRGLSELVAQLIADKADEKQTQAEERLRKEQNKGTNRKIIVGLIFCVGGLIVTFVTMDSGNGGIIAWGAILFGIIDIVIGASQRVSG